MVVCNWNLPNSRLGSDKGVIISRYEHFGRNLDFSKIGVDFINSVNLDASFRLVISINIKPRPTHSITH